MSTEKSTTAWQQWLDAVNEKRDQLQELGPQLDNARAERDRYQHGAHHYSNAIARACGIHFLESQRPPTSNEISVEKSGRPEKAQRDEVASKLRAAIRSHKSTGQYAPQTHEWKDNLDALAEREAGLAEAQQHLDGLTQQHDTIQAELDALDAQQPKASKSALDAIETEIAKARDDQLRVEQALANMDGDGSAHRLAQEEAERAQARLDDLEADAALGNVNEGEQRAAQAALAKARTKAQKSLEDANRQASARRGLESRLVAAERQVTDLSRIRNEVAAKIHAAALADAEAKLVAYLDGEELLALLANMTEHHEALEQCQEGISYQRALIEITLPTLYYHPDQDRLNRSRLELSA